MGDFTYGLRLADGVITTSGVFVPLRRPIELGVFEEFLIHKILREIEKDDAS